MYRIRRVLMFCLALVIAATAACAPAATPTPTPRPTPVPEKPTAIPTTPPEPTGFQLNDRIKQRAAAGEKLVFRLSYVDPALEFAQEIIRGIADAARDYDVDAKLVGPTPIDTAKQLAEIETLVEQGIDGLGVTSIDDAIFVPVMDRIIDQGIPVVTFNVDSPSSKRLAYFGQDNYLGAVAAGEEMMKYLGENPSGKVAILSHDPSFSSLQDRARGLTDVYSKYPGLELLGVFGNCGSDVDLCYSVIENLYTQHPDIKVMHAVDGVTTPTLARFMEKEGLTGQIFTAGWDLVPDSLQGVKRGDLLFTEGQFPYKFGYWAVEELFVACHGGPVDSRDVGAEIVDATNIDNYLQ
jgi:simple sugar transport system substrate-binding protein